MIAGLRAFIAWHPSLRYLQIIPVGLVLWGTDAVDRFRGGAQALGLAHAAVVNAISTHLGGGFATTMNAWLAGHTAIADVAAWYYILLQGAITAIAGLVLIRWRAPSLPLHRNALIAGNLVGLVAFWLYPVAPPRMLPGYHDVTAGAVPVFASLLEGKAADEYASLPSLHVAWALWVALALGVLLRRRAARAAVWLYPAATITDVLATANHYLLDVITAPGVLLIGYLVAAGPSLVRRLRAGSPARPASVIAVSVIAASPDHAPGPATLAARRGNADSRDARRRAA